MRDPASDAASAQESSSDSDSEDEPAGPDDRKIE